MKIVTIIARILLGLVFVVFGLNNLLHFSLMPALSGPAGNFLGAMASTGYLPVIATLQVVAVPFCSSASSSLSG